MLQLLTPLLTDTYLILATNTNLASHSELQISISVKEHPIPEIKLITIPLAEFRYGVLYLHCVLSNSFPLLIPNMIFITSQVCEDV